jgi:hypothetical protein
MVAMTDYDTEFDKIVRAYVNENATVRLSNGPDVIGIVIGVGLDFLLIRPTGSPHAEIVIRLANVIAVHLLPPG